jgi:hypothetical protein
MVNGKWFIVRGVVGVRPFLKMPVPAFLGKLLLNSGKIEERTC